MDTLLQLMDFVLHVDRYLEAFVANYGAWIYALLFLIVFVETGLVVMPFLPGDSLLFVVGTLCGRRCGHDPRQVFDVQRDGRPDLGLRAHFGRLFVW